MERVPDESQELIDEYREMFRLTPDELRGPLLDVASGAGEFIDFVRREYGNKNAFGVELDAEAAVEAGGAVVIADGKHLPFPDGTFPLVIAFGYVPMFLQEPDPQLPVQEMLRVTAPGGAVKFHMMTEEAYRQRATEVSAAGRRSIEKKREGLLRLQVWLAELAVQGYEVVTEPRPSGQALVIIRKP